jgi:Family of unknown function (DUF5518)
MKQETGRFWLGVIAGLIVMIPVALVMVNLLDLIPLVSPFIGGLIAGLIAGKGIQNGGKAGIAVGVLGAAVIALDFLLRTGYLQGLTAAFRTLNATLFIIVVVLYSAILAFIGGAVGGYLRP